MGNLSFSHNAAFSWYCILLMVAGIAMLLIGVLRNQSRGRQVIRLLFGLGFLGYGLYLAFIFGGGHYVVFFQAFIFPIAVIADWLRSTARRRQFAAPADKSPSSFGNLPPPRI